MTDVDIEQMSIKKRKRFLEMSGSKRLAFLEDLDLLEQPNYRDIDKDINKKKIIEAVL